MLNRIDSSADLMTLHIGDRILEVNGLPVQDQPLEKIENMLRSPDSTLQVILFLAFPLAGSIPLIENITYR